MRNCQTCRHKYMHPETTPCKECLEENDLRGDDYWPGFKPIEMTLINKRIEGKLKESEAKS